MTAIEGLLVPGRHGSPGEPLHIQYPGTSPTPSRLQEAQTVRETAASPTSIDIKVDTQTASPPVTQEHRQPEPSQEYGAKWEWDPGTRDYVRIGEDGVKQYYTDYQKPGAGPGSPGGGEGFQVVARPKRFFCVGRIFKAVWFEPRVPVTPSSDMPNRQQQSQSPDFEQWSNKCPEPSSGNAVSKFRWFVVVRRRLHHTLCFSITTFGGKGSAATSRGRPMDYVVLYSAAIKPAQPDDEERITRKPIAVIIEDEEQYISPFARLDCGRIYTVEDGLPIMKIGRVHPAHLPLLEEYYRESVL